MAVCGGIEPFKFFYDAYIAFKMLDINRLVKQKVWVTQVTIKNMVLGVT